jgi:hypothetical protein
MEPLPDLRIKDFLPLQAADFWAWWIQHWASERNDPVAVIGFPWKMLIDKPIMGTYSFKKDEIVTYIHSQYAPSFPAGSFVALPEKS